MEMTKQGMRHNRETSKHLIRQKDKISKMSHKNRDKTSNIPLFMCNS